MSDAAARVAATDAVTLVRGANAAELRASERSERWSLLGLTSPAVLLVLVIMVLPVGQSDAVQHLIRVRRTPEGLDYDELRPVRFVPLVEGVARDG